MTYPRIIAHRCGGALAPENTLAGLRIAARLGCRGVEFDAMPCADGVPFVIHDATLERTTDGSGSVIGRRATELARLDAGLRHHPAFAGEPLPLLDDALALCARLGLWANVEIKPAAGSDEAEAGHAVARHAARKGANVLLSSFSERALRAAAEVAPDVPRALLVGAVIGDWHERMAAVGAIALHADAALISPQQVGELRSAGVIVACYTVNDRAEGERLLAAGARALFTDRPDLWSPSEM